MTTTGYNTSALVDYAHGGLKEEALAKIATVRASVPSKAVSFQMPLEANPLDIIKKRYIQRIHINYAPDFTTAFYLSVTVGNTNFLFWKNDAILAHLFEKISLICGYSSISIPVAQFADDNKELFHESCKSVFNDGGMERTMLFKLRFSASETMLISKLIAVYHDFAVELIINENIWDLFEAEFDFTENSYCNFAQNICIKTKWVREEKKILEDVKKTISPETVASRADLRRIAKDTFNTEINNTLTFECSVVQEGFYIRDQAIRDGLVSTLKRYFIRSVNNQRIVFRRGMVGGIYERHPSEFWLNELEQRVELKKIRGWPLARPKTEEHKGKKDAVTRVAVEKWLLAQKKFREDNLAEDDPSETRRR